MALGKEKTRRRPIKEKEGRLRTKYQLRPQNLNGETINFDWISDSQIDSLLQMKTGKLISLVTAASLFYEAAINEDLTIDHQILNLGIVGYAISCGFCIDIFPEIEESKSVISTAQKN